MDIRPLNPNVWVSDQITADDIPVLKEMGFRAIISNRPEGEEVAQPAWPDIAAAAAAAGLGSAHIPVEPGNLTDEQVLEFRESVTGFNKPVLAFCRSGSRSAQLWALAARDRLSTDEVIRMAATAGYDLGGMRDRLDSSGR
jgi:sulfide:quinone oxidoreductase